MERLALTALSSCRGARMNLVRSQNLTVAGVVVHQDVEGRYSLNGLHKAAGEEQRHRPKYWLENDQTLGLISELKKGGNPPIYVQRGRSGGTFVCKELVYGYANWISPAFYLNLFGRMMLLLREVAIIYRWEVCK